MKTKTVPARTVIAMAIGSLVGFQLGYQKGQFATSIATTSTTTATSPTLANTATSATSTAMANHESFGFFDDISNVEWQLMKEKVHDVFPNVMGGNPNQLRTQNIKPSDFFQDHYEPDFSCQHERRIGRLGDGGKWVCDPHRLMLTSNDDDFKNTNTNTKQEKPKPKPKPCLVYSVGSNGDVSFEDAIKKQIGTHCEIHVFDMRDYTKPVTEAGAIFHQWGIATTTGTDGRGLEYGLEYKSLQQTVQELGHVGRTVDIFKIDCEGCEWTTFPAFFDSGVHLQQVLIELHSERDRVNPKHKFKLHSERDRVKPKSKFETMPAPATIDFFQAMYQNGYVITHKEVNIKSGRCIEYAFLKLHKDFFKGIPELIDSDSTKSSNKFNNNNNNGMVEIASS